MNLIPPIPLDEAYRQVHKGIEAIGDGSEFAIKALSDLSSKIPAWIKAHLEMEHTIPSPSNVTECRLKLWYRAKNIESASSPLGWKVRRAMGILAEPYWLATLNAGGLTTDAWSDTLQCGKYMTAHPDAVVQNEFLFEFKSQSGYGYKRLVESVSGVREQEWGHYMQAQLYMYAAKYEWLLYLTFPPDFGLVQSLLRQKKKYKGIYELQPVYLEWITIEQRIVEEGLRRAEMITNDIKSNSPPQREYDGIEFKMDGKTRTFPCGYCLYLKPCNKESIENEFTTIS